MINVAQTHSSNPFSSLNIRAGAKALAHIQQHGLRAQDVSIVPGAAGGPKGLGLAHLDYFIFGEWFQSAPRMRHLIGASIGAWRMAAACTKEPLATLKHFHQLYATQEYKKGPTRAVITESCKTVVDAFIGNQAEQIVSSLNYRLSVLTSEGIGALASEGPLRSPTGFVAALLANAVSRRQLGHFFSRAWFYDERDAPIVVPCDDGFRNRLVPLSAENLIPSLLASVAIPTVIDPMYGFEHSPQAPHWDGGLIDYHLHFPYNNAEGIVLYPHFTNYIIPGWLDKGLPWRKGAGRWLENVLLISPSKEFLQTLPLKKLPDRVDFKRFDGDNATRLKLWKQSISQCEQLAEAFVTMTRNDAWLKHVQPL